ncbi:response regulator receiver domain-containing protein [Pedobacter psychrotolerans]|uniref:Response regulator receiver domain-containing protein n=1 Tax=Pedobacter psychrotolerans TaxID=1843235 RepID=A0A4R2H577_9SPHI|nr:response regulator [Pedobacter psychrotolerans]TCO20667.1 response regulator receiver domain-containing protein [Pedobacter psychrotolerans]GGE67182.1 hypothetical protein GCM10011413_37270 [Pedobacter psychrotolerans]
MNALIIEDDAYHQKIITSYLSEYDVTTWIVEASEVLNQIKKGNFDLIFIAINESKFDGYKIVHSIRKVLKCNLPIVALSEQHVEEIKKKCFSAGMNAVLSKPVHRVEIAAIITQFAPLMIRSSYTDSKLDHSYAVIDLTYLKDISKGDAKFEKEITEKFLIFIDEHLKDLKQNLTLGFIDKFKMTAHQALSTIYIMGLNNLLEKPLKAIENENLSKSELAIILKEVEDIIVMAKADANKFLQTLI